MRMGKSLTQAIIVALMGHWLGRVEPCVRAGLGSDWRANCRVGAGATCPPVLSCYDCDTLTGRGNGYSAGRTAGRASRPRDPPARDDFLDWSRRPMSLAPALSAREPEALRDRDVGGQSARPGFAKPQRDVPERGADSGRSGGTERGPVA